MLHLKFAFIKQGSFINFSYGQVPNGVQLSEPWPQTTMYRSPSFGQYILYACLFEDTAAEALLKRCQFRFELPEKDTSKVAANSKTVLKHKIVFFMLV